MRTLSGLTSGCCATHSSVLSSRDSMPQEASQPWRRCSSVTRSGLVATSRPPTWRKQG